MKTPFILPEGHINSTLASQKLEVMNFLNQIAMHYPRAISFAPGRPVEKFFNVSRSLGYIDGFVAYECERSGGDKNRHGHDMLGQYGRTNGLIGTLVAELLANDYDIHVSPKDIVITVGSQEAMCLCLAVLCGNPGDVALTIDPAYVGFSGAARVLGISIVGIPCGSDGFDFAAFERIYDDLRNGGRKPKLLYISPDSANPTGLSLNLDQRTRLLAVARERDLVLIEDGAYNYYFYDSEPLPSLKSMTGGERVIYLGSFSKSIYPGLRLGFLVADQFVMREGVEPSTLSNEISKAKSFLTVNTSPITQAIAAGLLIQNKSSLRNFVQPRVAALRENRDEMVNALERYFPKAENWCQGISWKKPAGGFFLTLTLPFEVGDSDLLASAREFGVTWTPMAYFHVDLQHSRQLRLSFSYGSASEIHDGVARLAAWVKHRLGTAES